MTTPAQIIDWISDKRGVCIDRTGHFGAQAPDLVNDCAAELYGLPHIFGHGHDVGSFPVRLTSKGPCVGHETGHSITCGACDGAR